MHNFFRFLETIKYLRGIQIYFRLFYWLRRQFKNNFFQHNDYSKTSSLKSHPLILSSFPHNYHTYTPSQTFTFLNQRYKFSSKINWNYSNYGKLWTYNLNYFDYLHQENITKEEGLSLIYDFINQFHTLKDAIEPFPSSLRTVNWIKFISYYHIEDLKISLSLYQQYRILLNNLEYHLLGNHLLENAFSLLFGAYYFQDHSLYEKANKLLSEELKEQIMQDGGHFELSPMYHQLILFRVLEAINLIQHNHWQRDELLILLKNTATKMMAWLNQISYKDGSIPLLNDSANTIAPTTKQLNSYSSSLGITPLATIKLNESGYRKIRQNNYEMIIDIGSIEAHYIPGHTHSDIFNFELHINHTPFIVDTGTSTYENNTRRHIERSTYAHNTVVLESHNQSDVWSSFRVGSRASVQEIIETPHSIQAIHNGYQKHFNALHRRTFFFEKRTIKIIDEILSSKSYHAIARLHFHPEIKLQQTHHTILANGIQLNIKNDESVNFNIKEYNYASEFNKLITAKVIEIPFSKYLEVEILL